MANNKYSKDEKLAILAWYHAGNTLVATCEKYKVSHASILKWQRMVQSGHPEHLEPARRQKNYSAAFKHAAIAAYYNGEGTVREIAWRIGLRTPDNLYAWLKKYTEGEVITSSSGGQKYMEGRRKTTIEERLEIVKFCLDNNRDYKMTAKRYLVSYNQVYRWVRSYEEKGAKGLEDRRGKAKQEHDLTEEDCLRRELQKVKREKRELEVEVALLKKLEELERESR
jgi:transposase-like protein